MNIHPPVRSFLANARIYLIFARKYRAMSEAKWHCLKLFRIARNYLAMSEAKLHYLKLSGSARKCLTIAKNYLAVPEDN